VPLAAYIYGSSDSNGLLILSGIGFAAGIALFIYGFRLLQRRRLIIDTPFSKIRSASMGMVEISGLAVGPYTMVAPVTARPCYYYRTQIWEWKKNGKDKQWVKVARECMYVPFFVDDNTGRLLVDPRGADLDLHCDFEQEFSDSLITTKDPVPDTVRAFLSRHGIVTTNKIKVEEYCIKPKNSLFILGTLADNPGLQVVPTPVRDDEPVASFSSHGFSISMSPMSFGRGSDPALIQVRELPAPVLTTQHSSQQIIQLSPEMGTRKSSDMTQQQKIAAALLKAGTCSPAAWEAAGVDSATKVQVLAGPATEPRNSQTPSDSNGFESRPPIVLTKGTANRTFLISWRSQQDIARSLGWKSSFMIWGGPALALVSLYMFLSLKNRL
jgi:E3 Ubiquitin ligase.